MTPANLPTFVELVFFSIVLAAGITGVISFCRMDSLHRRGRKIFDDVAAAFGQTLIFLLGLVMPLYMVSVVAFPVVR